MRFTDLASSATPLVALVEFALAAKGVTVTRGTIDRYASLLDAAIRADEGEPIDHTPFVGTRLIKGSYYLATANAECIRPVWLQFVPCMKSLQASTL